jgi:hypothetical protein
MNEKLCELLIQIEALSDKELQIIKTWTEYNISKRDFIKSPTFPHNEE